MSIVGKSESMLYTYMRGSFLENAKSNMIVKVMLSEATKWMIICVN